MKAGWKARSLGELCHVIGGGTPSKDKAEFYSGEIPWATVRDMRSELITETECKITSAAVKSSATNVIPSGNVVIATRVGLGKVCLLAHDTAINQDLRGIVPIDASVLAVRFLFWWLKSISDQIVAEGTGATVQGVKLPFVKSLQVPLPPLPVQQRIVTLLDEAFDGIATARAHAERNLQNARELFGSQAQAMLEAAGNDWERVSLSELLERGWIVSHLDGNHGGDYPRKEEFVNSGIPYISAKALKDGQVDFGEAKYLSIERAATIRKGLAKDRDVIFAHNATVGPVAILSTDEDAVILGTSLTYYRCDQQNIHPEYLAHFMRSPPFVSQYSQVMGQSTRNQVPITKQREFFHVIPPFSKQMRIASNLDILLEQTERLGRTYQQKITSLNDLKKSLLHQAFAGLL